MRLCKRIEKVFFGLLFACVLALCGMLFFFNIKPVVVVSGSMEPEVPVGSLAFIDQNKMTVKAGDIIGYQMGDTLIVHRVIDEKETGEYITKGDANDTADPAAVSEQQIRGKEVFCIPAAGYAVQFIRTKKGIITVGIVIAGYFLLKVLLRRRKEHRDS